MHTAYLLSGQGINLDFMDISELIGQFRRLHEEGKDIGQCFYLKHYERKRRYSAALMLASTQGFHQLFSGNNLTKKMFCDVGLLLSNTIPPIKLKFLNYALGLHDIPEWLAKIMINSL